MEKIQSTDEFLKVLSERQIKPEKQMTVSQQNTIKTLIETAKSLPTYKTLSMQFGEAKADEAEGSLVKASFALRKVIEILKRCP